ncbi:MAG: hypothetical protein L0331_05860 [Chloroflexi bacterium]|nr:hypothetical protein [Chloroflexota bacterium]
MGVKGGIALREKRGREYFQEIGRRGGRATVEKHGRLHMVQIGKRGFVVTTARYFMGSDRLHVKWLVTMGHHWYWKSTGLTMKYGPDGRPVWPPEAPVHPAALAAPGQESLFERVFIAQLESLPF